MSTPNFLDPAEGLPRDDILRTSVEYNRATVSFLRGIHGRANTAQVTANILLAKLEAYLKHLNITAYDPDSYERTITNLELRSPTTVPPTRRRNTNAAKTTDRDVR